MECGRVNHIWCLGVVSHGYGGLVRAWMEVVDGEHAGQSQEEYVACRVIPEHIPSARR